MERNLVKCQSDDHLDKLLAETNERYSELEEKMRRLTRELSILDHKKVALEQEADIIEKQFWHQAETRLGQIGFRWDNKKEYLRLNRKTGNITVVERNGKSDGKSCGCEICTIGELLSGLMKKAEAKEAMTRH